MSKWANRWGPIKGRKQSKRFGPPGADNIVRFARSLWPKPEQCGELCGAAVEAAFIIVCENPDAEARRSFLTAMLDRTYEELKAL